MHAPSMTLRMVKSRLDVEDREDDLANESFPIHDGRRRSVLLHAILTGSDPNKWRA